MRAEFEAGILMRALIPTRNLVAGAMLAALAACSQNPQFRMSTANRTYASLSDLYVLLAKAELGAFRSTSSFGDSVDGYASVVGGFQLGRLLEADPTVSLDAERRSLGGAVSRCVAQLKNMSAIHGEKGIDPGDPVIQAVRNTCDAAAVAVAATETSSWLFSTAAGDV